MKTIRLTESDLMRIVKLVLKEQTSDLQGFPPKIKILDNSGKLTQHFDVCQLDFVSKENVEEYEKEKNHELYSGEDNILLIGKIPEEVDKNWKTDCGDSIINYSCSTKKISSYDIDYYYTLPKQINFSSVVNGHLARICSEKKYNK